MTSSVGHKYGSALGLIILICGLLMYGCGTSSDLRVMDKKHDSGQKRVTGARTEPVPQDKKTFFNNGSSVATDRAGKGKGSPENRSRLFFKPSSSPLTQILGIDFTLMEDAKSSLTITTDKKAEYSTGVEGPKRLILHFENTTIPPLLLRRLDTQYFGGAVRDVKADHSAKGNHVSLRIDLRENVPYKFVQYKGILKVDFAPFAPRPKALISENSSRNTSQKEKNGLAETETKSKAYEAGLENYAGERMSFEFVDTDIRNILRLIAEVAGLNIVWGSDVEGKISLKLEHVPWDQALEMVLKPNGLTYQIEDDVLWVVPKASLVDMEIREKDRRTALMAQKRLEGIFEPKILEYITVRHRKAEDIFIMLIGDLKTNRPGVLDIEGGKTEEEEKGEEEKGKRTKLLTIDIYLTYDPDTNIIIVNGVRSKVEKVKDIIARLDVPQKQVMIEARIVEASTSFERDIGVNLDLRWKFGDVITQFATNFSASLDTASFGISFAKSASKIINAKIALAEQEGNVTVLSAPKIITRDAATAYIKQGTQIAVPSGRDEFGYIIYKMADAVLELKVTPKITANNMVVMTIDVKDDEPDYNNVQQGTENVPIKTKRAHTEMMVTSGETVVIGGIYKETKSFKRQATPWLSKIPILGWLFKMDTDKTQRIELLIFLTPRVVTVAPGEAVDRNKQQ